MTDISQSLAEHNKNYYDLLNVGKGLCVFESSPYRTLSQPCAVFECAASLNQDCCSEGWHVQMIAMNR